ncbi:MAG: hypothetical protein CBE00_04120 [Planctomycetaceae bacterium TMED240]|nr:hypothetical protein [Rhodopirellula sp.]OUX07688.1 MAG: hypothetical protein CBE00_04120 [Planctomycetaceae bacterium TMED240]
MSLRRKKRCTTIFDPEVQGSVIRKITMHWGIFFSCNVLALLIWVRLFEQPDASWKQTFSDTVCRFLPFFVVTLVLIPAFIWDTLKLTSRFAGPILRLREALFEAGKGRPVPPLRFRDNDFWQEMASNFNLLMEDRETEHETTSAAEPRDQ